MLDPVLNKGMFKVKLSDGFILFAMASAMKGTVDKNASEICLTAMNPSVIKKSGIISRYAF